MGGKKKKSRHTFCHSKCCHHATDWQATSSRTHATLPSLAVATLFTLEPPLIAPFCAISGGREGQGTPNADRMTGTADLILLTAITPNVHQIIGHADMARTTNNINRKGGKRKGRKNAAPSLAPRREPQHARAYTHTTRAGTQWRGRDIEVIKRKGTKQAPRSSHPPVGQVNQPAASRKRANARTNHGKR